jgi:anti-sigma-K factor RskA
MKHMSPEIGDQLAAEYVLGTMPTHARQRFEALLKTNPQLRRVVAEWEARLTPMASSVAEVTPPQRVWRAIQNRIFGNFARRQEMQSGWMPSSWMPSSWWNSLGFWRAAAGFATISLFALGLLVLAPTEIDPAKDSMMVVVMEDTQTQAPAMTVSWEAGGDSHRILRLRVIGHAQMAPDTAWELWLLPRDDRAPVSLGLITTHELQMLRIPKSLAQPLDEAWGLGMTVEPKGGSPSGRPTNPMLYAGRCVMA